MKLVRTAAALALASAATVVVGLFATAPAQADTNWINQDDTSWIAANDDTSW